MERRTATEPDSGARPNRVARLFGLASHQSRQELKRLGITRIWTANVPVGILVGLLLLAPVVIAIAAATDKLSSELAVAAATAMITIAGLLVAVLQWRAGLAEKALDALYGRIALANEMRMKLADGLGIDDDVAIATKRPNEYRLFVFTEIDSLEYAAMRYRFGLGMTAVIADRAVDHFCQRCESEKFKEMARVCAREGAYFPDTKAMVKKILKECPRNTSL